MDQQENSLVSKALAILRDRSQAVTQQTRAETHIDAPLAIEGPVVSAQTILAEHGADDVGKVVEVWRRLFGFSESRERITAHLAQLERWQNKKIEKA
jgi:hypothetical protein